MIYKVTKLIILFSYVILLFSCGEEERKFVKRERYLSAVDDLLMRVNTDVPGSVYNDQFWVSTPLHHGTYDYAIDCNGDGVWDALNQTGTYLCDYSDIQGPSGPGEYTIRIRGLFSGFSIGTKKLIAIEQWGYNAWEKLDLRSQSLLMNAQDTPDLSLNPSLAFLFNENTNIHNSTGNWN